MINFINDFKKILQCYFNIYNINLDNDIIYGIKKKYISII